MSNAVMHGESTTNTISLPDSTTKPALERVKVTNGATHVGSYVDNLEAVTPHDTNANAYFPLWVDVAGALQVRLAGMTSGSVTINVPAGWLPLHTSLILTGTTATVYGKPVA